MLPKLRIFSKEMFVRFLLLCVGVVVPLLLLEGACRILPLDWSEEQARFYRYDPELGWKGKPNASGTFRTVDFSSWVQLNSRGLRAPETAYKVRPQERRILVLGDSFTWGFGVNANERFTETLQSELNNTSVLNAGCSGYGTDQELLFYRSEGRKYTANTVVVALHLRSDVKNNIASRQYGSYKPVAWSENGKLIFKNIPVAQNSWGAATTNALKKRSALFVWLFGRKLGETKTGEMFANGINILALDRDPPEITSNYSPADVTCALASMLTTEIKNSNSGAVFLVIPDIRPETRQIEEKPEYSDIRKCLSTLDAQVVDLTNPLVEALKNDATTPIVFKHDLHWTPAGHRIVGKALAQALSAR